MSNEHAKIGPGIAHRDIEGINEDRESTSTMSAGQQKPETLYEKTLAELEALMQTWGYPAYRARQVFHHLYHRLTPTVEEMHDLPLALRQRLVEECPMGALKLVHTRTSGDGQTHKALFALPDAAPGDGHGLSTGGGANGRAMQADGKRHGTGVIETVLMLSGNRVTVCVSTQAGCAIGCTFCATGQQGLWRNLHCGEIVEQVIWAARVARAMHRRERHLNVVFMGMGEPFANYDAWWKAVERLHDPQGFHLGARHMTVSTVGLVPGIRRLATEALPINLAISLHAPNDALRNQLVPINRRYPIDEVLAAARDYIAATHRRVSFEYVLIEGYNDQPRHAQQLASLLRGSHLRSTPLLFHVNLIPLNPVDHVSYMRPHRRSVLDFQSILVEHHIACTVRVERGSDIAAACGQLAGTRGMLPKVSNQERT